jgi:CDP-diacylglycerol--glycerol-3-phosphate 3-phosphatidyltransferase
MNAKLKKYLTPNNLTLARLVLSIGFFILLAFAKPNSPSTWWYLDLSVALFILAGVSDLVDGYLARRYNMETSIGRLLDPFVDKIMIGGSFIFFCGPNFVVDGKNVTDVTPWIVTIIIARELLVTTLRGHSEANGYAFPAMFWGKIKMFLQTVTVVVVLISIAHFSQEPWAHHVRLAFIWAMVISTLLSMVGYITKFYSTHRAELTQPANFQPYPLPETQAEIQAKPESTPPIEEKSDETPNQAQE